MARLRRLAVRYERCNDIHMAFTLLGCALVCMNQIRRILITSHRAVGDWGTVLGDQVVATAILDRLLHHSHVLTIRGHSYGLREKRRSGLIKAPPPPPG